MTELLTHDALLSHVGERVSFTISENFRSIFHLPKVDLVEGLLYANDNSVVFLLSDLLDGTDPYEYNGDTEWTKYCFTKSFLLSSRKFPYETHAIDHISNIHLRTVDFNELEEVLCT